MKKPISKLQFDKLVNKVSKWRVAPLKIDNLDYSAKIQPSLQDNIYCIMQDDSKSPIFGSFSIQSFKPKSRLAKFCFSDGFFDDDEIILNLEEKLFEKYQKKINIELNTFINSLVLEFDKESVSMILFEFIGLGGTDYNNYVKRLDPNYGKSDKEIYAIQYLQKLGYKINK